MNPYIAIAALLVVVGAALGGYRFGLTRANEQWAAKLAVAQREAIQNAEAASRYAEKARLAIEATHAAIEDALITEDGGDAPLSDYLRRGAGRLWP